MNAIVGYRDVTVTNPNAATSTCVACLKLFPAPTFTSVTPTKVIRGTTVVLTITGTALNKGVTVAFSGGGITVGTITRVSATQITVSITVSPTAVVGRRTITITNTNGGTVAKKRAINIA